MTSGGADCVEEQEKKIDFLVRTSLIRSATKSLILIDNYIDESVLLMLSKRQDGVTAEIRTGRLTETLKQELARHKTSTTVS